MLDELGDAMDNTDARLTRETQHVIKVTEKAKSGGAFHHQSLYRTSHARNLILFFFLHEPTRNQRWHWIITDLDLSSNIAGMCCCIVLLVIAIIAVAAVG